MTLRFDQVAELVRIIDASACEEVVIETGDLKLVMRRGGAGLAPATPPVAAARSPAATGQVAPASAVAPAPTAPPQQTSGSVAAPGEVRSPMVGTFFRASSPEAPPFVEVGSRVRAGDPLCIIEVMKLFTTIYAEADGTVAEIGAGNGELVDYGRVLFVLEL